MYRMSLSIHLYTHIDTHIYIYTHNIHIQMKIAIPKMCICNSFKKPVDHGIIQFISTCKWHKWRNAKVFKYNEVIFIGENKSYYSSVQNNVVYLYMLKMLEIYRSTKLLNSALSSEKQKKDAHEKIVSSRMESLGHFL